MQDEALPEVLSGELDRAGVGRLFDDLSACADVLQILSRPECGGDGHAPLTLGVARRRLLTGAATALQIRYRYDGDTWCDTLMAQGGGARLVRMKQET